jgi:hypothetical protein
VLLAQLTSDRLAVRKRATTALAHLGRVCTNALYTHLLTHVVQSLKNSKCVCFVHNLLFQPYNRSSSLTRTYVTCLMHLCRNESRCASHLNDMIPLLIKYAQQYKNGNAESDELSEGALHAMDAIIYACAKVRVFIIIILLI